MGENENEGSATFVSSRTEIPADARGGYSEEQLDRENPAQILSSLLSELEGEAIARDRGLKNTYEDVNSQIVDYVSANADEISRDMINRPGVYINHMRALDKHDMLDSLDLSDEAVNAVANAWKHKKKYEGVERTNMAGRRVSAADLERADKDEELLHGLRKGADFDEVAAD